jgi:hypothetical protein
MAEDVEGVDHLTERQSRVLPSVKSFDVLEDLRACIVPVKPEQAELAIDGASEVVELVNTIRLVVQHSTNPF